MFKLTNNIPNLCILQQMCCLFGVFKKSIKSNDLLPFIYQNLLTFIDQIQILVLSQSYEYMHQVCHRPMLNIYKKN